MAWVMSADIVGEERVPVLLCILTSLRDCVLQGRVSVDLKKVRFSRMVVRAHPHLKTLFVFLQKFLKLFFTFVLHPKNSVALSLCGAIRSCQRSR